jgi:hypothetical protein
MFFKFNMINSAESGAFVELIFTIWSLHDRSDFKDLVMFILTMKQK